MANHAQIKKPSKVPKILLTIAVVVILGFTAYNSLRPSQASGSVVSSVVSKPGPVGPKGAQGAAGVGSAGTAGATGKTGSAGKAGKSGSPGAVGKNGNDGANGLSVTSVTCNPDSSWTFTMSNGTALQASGPCMGTTGEQGPQGPPIGSFTFKDFYGFENVCTPSPGGSTDYSCING